jgi:hypothetical protein
LDGVSDNFKKAVEQIIKICSAAFLFFICQIKYKTGKTEIAFNCRLVIKNSSNCHHNEILIIYNIIVIYKYKSEGKYF